MTLGVQREQGWRRLTRIEGLTCVRHRGEDIAVLLLEGGHPCPHGFDNPRPSDTLGPKAALAPQAPWADRPVGRLGGAAPPLRPAHRGTGRRTLGVSRDSPPRCALPHRAGRRCAVAPP